MQATWVRHFIQHTNLKNRCCLAREILKLNNFINYVTKIRSNNKRFLKRKPNPVAM